MKMVRRFQRLQPGILIRFRQGDEVFSGMLRWKIDVAGDEDVMDVDEDSFKVLVQLSSEFAGRGNSDGIIDGRRVFACRKNYAMLVSLSQIILDEESSCLEQATERAQVDGVTIDRAANLQALEERLDCLDPSLLNALKRSHRRDYIPGGFLNRKRKVINSRGNNILNIELQELIRQVKSKSSAHAETPKSYPTVYSGMSLLAALPDISATERQNLELVSVHVTIPFQHLENFRKVGVLKGVTDISGCSVTVDEDLSSLVLTGLVSETNAAKLLLDEQVASFDLPQDGKETKPVRNRKKKNKPSCGSDACAQPSTIPSQNSDVVKNLAVHEKPQTRVAQVEKECGTPKIVDEGSRDADQAKIVVSSPEVAPPITSDESTKAAADLGSSEQLGVPGGGSAPEEDQIVDCVVCLTERPTVAFIPCGHRYTCATCAKKIFDSDSRSCPACRETIERCYRIWV